MPKLPTLFEVLGITVKNIQTVSRELSIEPGYMRYCNEYRKLPSDSELDRLCEYFKLSPNLLKLKLGVIDNTLAYSLSKQAESIAAQIPTGRKNIKRKHLKPNFKTQKGKLYQGDCIEVIQSFGENSVDLIFADPPFNLNKLYPSKINDLLKEDEYIHWQERWIEECIRVLKYGGAFFIWNLPKWNTYNSHYLNSRLTLRHWITVDIKYSLPIQGRLYPSHYSLLYYIKGDRPNTFNPDRLPMEICPKCMADLKDYGGYKDKMNPKGVNLSDVWYDIPPVRHNKYKRRKGANELSLKLLDRIIECSSEEGDTILDPFGGSGTTYIVAELKNRKWIGTEIGPLNDIINRFSLLDTERDNLTKIRKGLNCLFTNESLKTRRALKLWTPDSVKKPKEKTLFD